MPQFGTIQVYEELAKLLNEDEGMAAEGKDLNDSMLFTYTEPIDKSFLLRFVEGKVVETREFSRGETAQVDFGLTAAPDVWRGIFSGDTKPTVALMAGKIKVDGSMIALVKKMKSFSRLLDLLTKIELS